MKKAELLKDLPDIPKGAIFEFESSSQTYILWDGERKVRSYKKDVVVENNPEWFRVFEDIEVGKYYRVSNVGDIENGNIILITGKENYPDFTRFYFSPVVGKPWGLQYFDSNSIYANALIPATPEEIQAQKFPYEYKISGLSFTVTESTLINGSVFISHTDDSGEIINQEAYLEIGKRKGWL